MLGTVLSENDHIPVKYLNILKKQNIVTVDDLLTCFPRRFEDYTIVDIKDVIPETTVTIVGIVRSGASVIITKTGLSVMTFYIDGTDGKLKITVFNRHFLKFKIKYGVFVRLTGKLKEDGKSFVASEIHFGEPEGNINPVFNIPKIPDRKMLAFKENIFAKYADGIEENLPASVREEYNLAGKRESLRWINIPEEMAEVKAAIRRLKFEELLLYQLKIKYLFYMRKNFPNGVSVDYDEKEVASFTCRLPFHLTPDQNKSLKEILADLKAPYKMNRLLQGEVGSGKTVVAAIAVCAAMTAGYQAALMVPTEVLAKQHFATFRKLFSGYFLKGKEMAIELLSSSVSGKERAEILRRLATGETDLLIGTHALFQKDVVFAKLGLVVTDEEHRFGVRQRVSIVGKGYLIDHLKMSATPIPRTLAISVLGESDISVIKTLPGNKKEPITVYLKYEDSKIVFNHIDGEIKKGHQIYVICPMIKESSVTDLKNATEIYGKMVAYYHGICTVGLIHGKLKNDEKETIMEKFVNNEIQILVSTSVIEVGVNVINATTAIILDADRFGIAQLHQMRGRVRRSDEQSYCFLISNATATASVERLKLVAASADGFALAEADLENRGPGDFFGEKQKGAVPFKMADIVLDKELFEQANSLADRLIESRALFDDQGFRSLKETVHENYMLKKEMLE